MIEAMRTKFSISYASLAQQMGLSYRTLMRWKKRICDGQTAVWKRGPKKVNPLNLSELKERIKGLDHGRKRSRCTGVLYGSYKRIISRREFNEMIADVRRDRNRQAAASKNRLIWRQPNLVWALDGFEYAAGFTGGKMHVQNLQDLCSRYKLPPLTTMSLPCGEEVAGHLDHHFTRFGPPLFIKRDNGGNLNHLGVNQLLEEAMVIPINSPVESAPYNGAIEHSQGEIKGFLNKWKDKAGNDGGFCLLVEIAAQDLNHKPRRSLGGRTACNRFFGKDRARYSKRERNAAYRWIRNLAIDLSVAAGKDAITSTAWRIAAKKWLVENKLLTILKPGKVSPHFSSNLCHN